MIPKRIFTTWISEKPAPDIFYHCFESWHRLMPDYEIKILNLETVVKDDYMKARLADKNYLMAGHWARLTELLTNGGIYVDIDIEAVKRWDDLLENDFFLGHEGKDNHANNAIMGSVAGSPFVKEMLEYTRTFPLSHPEHPNETGPRMVTKLLKAMGWDGIDKDKMLGFVKIYNSKRFYPYFWDEKFTPECVTPETYAIHRWCGSWLPEEVLKKIKKGIK